MTGLKYDIGAILVLITSVPLIHQQMQFEKEEAESPPPARGSDDEFAVMSARISIGEPEAGEVIARSEYANSEPSYLIRYRDGTGKQVEEWWAESALTTMEDVEEAFEAEARIRAEQEAAAGGGEQERQAE